MRCPQRGKSAIEHPGEKANELTGKPRKPGLAIPDPHVGFCAPSAFAVHPRNIGPNCAQTTGFVQVFGCRHPEKKRNGAPDTIRTCDLCLRRAALNFSSGRELRNPLRHRTYQVSQKQICANEILQLEKI
jgi:hypothetical protein